MSGTGRVDQNISQYHMDIDYGKKCYWALLTWILDTAKINAWQIHWITGRQMAKLKFRRELVLTYITRLANLPLSSLDDASSSAVLAKTANGSLVAARTVRRGSGSRRNQRFRSRHSVDKRAAVLPLKYGILTISMLYLVFSGFFPLPPVYCLAWICLDVLFCTASIMHLCTISVDRYLSLRYPMKFGRNKTRRRVTLKIVFVWILSIAMSLPLSLMYSQVSWFKHYFPLNDQ
ncbi:hypothetical protein GE061_002794 [Apolygus lucorum]|uniref:G-protein coupled receptors family 1 profile domain-containing protein n=1 Tax=Apolygus lucorum TaxID=248454 RepID=A0A8S9X656_APOLU|nr:hypothetical protein GE061_002794 [Apolygus lucorum]